MVSLTGLSSSIALSFSLDTVFSSAAIGLEHEIARDQDADGETRPDGDGGLHVKGPADDALADLVDAICPTASNGSDQLVLAAAWSDLRSDTQQRREDGRLEQHAPMIVDFVLETGIPFRVGARLAFQHDRPSVGHDETRPHQERPRLAKRDLRVVLANEAGPLRDQAELDGRAVIDIFGPRRRDLTRQVRAYACEQGRGDDGTGLEHIGACRRGDAIGTDRAAIDVAVEKGELVIL